MRAPEIPAVIGSQAFRRKIDFANQYSRGEFVDHPSHPGDGVMDFSLIGGVQWQESLAGGQAFTKIGIGRVIAKVCILDQVPDHIHAEAVDSLPEPKAHYVVDSLAHL